ncbi:DUF2787 domain-containing protein [Vibrio atlanticus]|uniref:DUF2787 domain-containing protein n=1 Tax=Vibrio TaxID=662 RepID=UPI0035533C99
MKLTYGDKLGLPVSDEFKQLLQQELDKHSAFENVKAITFNYRSSDYSPDNGGYHPVEIRLEKKGGKWHFAYLTDFAYVGPYLELEKELDFDVTHGVLLMSFVGEIPLTHPEAQSLFVTYQGNVINYVKMEVFDDIQLTLD